MTAEGIAERQLQPLFSAPRLSSFKLSTPNPDHPHPVSALEGSSLRRNDGGQHNITRVPVRRMGVCCILFFLLAVSEPGYMAYAREQPVEMNQHTLWAHLHPPGQFSVGLKAVAATP